MSAIAKMTGAEFDAMIERGAFDSLAPKKVELIHGELRLNWVSDSWSPLDSVPSHRSMW